MNVTFHALTAVATAAALSPKVIRVRRLTGSREFTLCAVGFTAGVLLHGVLDMLPHQYPLRTETDIALTLLLSLVPVALARPGVRLILMTSLFGCVFPDLVDLGSQSVNGLFGTHLPTPSIFPWHWPQYRGSVFNGTHTFELHWWYIAVAVLSAGVCFWFRRTAWLKFSKSSDKSRTEPPDLGCPPWEM